MNVLFVNFLSFNLIHKAKDLWILKIWVIAYWLESSLPPVKIAKRFKSSSRHSLTRLTTNSRSCRQKKKFVLGSGETSQQFCDSSAYESLVRFQTDSHKSWLESESKI
jgi:hypothetical protein